MENRFLFKGKMLGTPLTGDIDFSLPEPISNEWNEWHVGDPQICDSRKQQRSIKEGRENDADTDDSEDDGDAIVTLSRHVLEGSVDESSINHQDQDRNLLTWTDGSLIEANRPPISIPAPAEELEDPYNYFEYFFDEELINMITNFTNCALKLRKPNAFSEEVTPEEIRKFLGIWIYMGICQLPGVRDYWAPDTQVSQVANFMTYNRFQTLRSSLHFYDKSLEDQLDPQDRFRKVSPLLLYIKQKCNDLEQESQMSIDEVMVPYKGRYAGNLRQFIMNKPHKFGFKIFALASSSGIIHDFFPYAGASTFNNMAFSPEEEEMGAGAKIVIALTKVIDQPEKTTLYFDNYFSSLKLLSHLQANYNILASATIRSNRIGNCPLKSDKELKKQGRGAFDSKLSNDGVQIVKWVDNKIVHMASTFVGALPLGVAQRYDKKSHDKVQVPCPRVIQFYNKNMGGVDLNDMMVENYRLPVRSKRWYTPLIGYMIDLCLTNSWLLYKRHVQSLSDQNDQNQAEDEENENKVKPLRNSKEFRISVSKSLRGVLPLKPGRPSKVSQRQQIISPRGVRPADSVRYDGIAHWATFQGNQSRCKFCKDGFSTARCVKCGLSLCLTSRRNCFMAYHTQ